ncbi:hypothetical protein PCANC_15248 [Puccinia coronata f. sp. avenae]|uniref:Uncharacterized protein n=1 Tax=Puccinia coronata f. sp. avenae TaxID=200324 RepID=A0A2N5VNH3_9BASI|nr:hypothetical protein PCANC_15248 [Puccinia coronata f. sp. avenae]
MNPGAKAAPDIPLVDAEATGEPTTKTPPPRKPDPTAITLTCPAFQEFHGTSELKGLQPAKPVLDTKVQLLKKQVTWQMTRTSGYTHLRSPTFSATATLSVKLPPQPSSGTAPPPDSNENVLATSTNHPSNNPDPNTTSQQQNYSALGNNTPAPTSTSNESYPAGTTPSPTHADNTTSTSKQPLSTVPKPSSTEEPNPNPTPNQPLATAAPT